MNQCCTVMFANTVCCLLPNDVACTGLSVELGLLQPLVRPRKGIFLFLVRPASHVKMTSCCCCFEANRTPSGKETVNIVHI